MIPIWKPSMIQRGLSSNLCCQTSIARIPLRLAQPQLPVSSRLLWTTSRISNSVTQGPPNHLKQITTPKSFFIKNDRWTIRSLATSRRGSSRKPASKPASSNDHSRLSKAEHPDNLGVNPSFTDPKSGALSTDTEHMAVGSKEWYDYYYQRARISDKVEPVPMSAFRRLLPSFLFLLAVLGSSAYYATTYVPPANKDRLFPNMPMSMATVVGIILTNAVILLSWRVPPFWRFLNTHFVQCPGEPRIFALVGNTFSHQAFWHFGANMLGLFLLGTTLCEQIGRGNFLALYFSSAALSSFSSLAVNVFLQRFHVFGLGASGAVFGVLGGYATLNPDSEVYFILLPLFTLKAVTVATVMGVYEFVALIFGWSMRLDHAAHLGGLLFGAGLTAWLKEEARRRRTVEVRKQLGKDS